MNINKLAEIAKNSGIKNSNNLRDNIVSEYSDTINSLNTIEESVINKNIEQLPVYKINEGHYSKSFETFLQIFFGNSVAKNYKENNEYKFDVRDNKIRTSPNYGYDSENKALLYYAYGIVKVDVEKGSLLYNKKDENRLEKTVYLYKFTKKDIEIKDEGSFKSLCAKYNVSLKLIDDSKLKDRDSVYKKMLTETKKEVAKIKVLNSKCTFKPDKDNYNDFIKGVDDSINLCYADLWKIYPDARTHDVEDQNTNLWSPFNEMIKKLNEKVPENYKIDSNGDWDDVTVDLEYTGKLNESYLQEGYAIDLDSLKYVVESENIALEEAVQKIRDVNYIGDTYPMYCVLREGFNEKMSVDNFCTLYESLTEAGIEPVCNNTISYNDFINEYSVGKATKNEFIIKK